MASTRYFILIPLLAASHGLVIWAGVATRGSGKHATAAAEGAGNAGAEEEKIELSQFVGPEEPKKSPDKAAGMEWRKRYEGALQSFPGAADLAAIVKEGTADKTAVITPETCAAFAVWMERDAVTALRWHTGWHAASGTTSFSEGIHRYIGSHPVSDLNLLLISVPEARDTLLGAAAYQAKAEDEDKGVDDIAKLAAGLSNGGDRMWLLSSLRSVDGLGPHLAEIRGGLDERGMREFLKGIGKLEHAGDLIDAVREAGFSDDAVRGFEKAVADNAEAWRQKSMGVADLLRSGGLGHRDLESKLVAELPDFAGWCKDFGDARLSADEVMARMKAGMADSAGLDDAMRDIIFRKLFPMRPEAAVGWLREHRGDWQGPLKQVVDDLPSQVSLEELRRLADSMSVEEAKACGTERNLMNRYEWWYQRDPEHCAAAVDRLPAGTFKETVRKNMLERAEREARLK